MAEPSNLIKFAADTVAFLWKEVGGAHGLMRAAVKVISVSFLARADLAWRATNKLSIN